MSLSITPSDSSDDNNEASYIEIVRRVYNQAGVPEDTMEEIELFLRNSYLREDWDEQRAALIEKFLLERANDDDFINAKLKEHKKEVEEAKDELDKIMGGEGAHLKRKLSDDEVHGPKDESDDDLIDSDYF